MKDEEFFFRIFCALMAGFMVGYLCCAISANEIIRDLYDALDRERRAPFHEKGDN